MSTTEVKANVKTITYGTKIISFDESYFLTLYEQKKFEVLSKEILDILVSFHNESYSNIDNTVVGFFNNFLQTFFYLVCRQDFIIPDQYVKSFVQMNSVICSITAISNYRTTCVPLSVILSQQHNFVKILMLLNPYNQPLNIKLLFDVNPALTSIWYYQYLSRPGSSAHPVCYKNLKYALQNVDERLLINYPETAQQATVVMFLSTNYDCNNDKLIKYKLNQLIANSVGEFKALGKPNKKKIAIASGKWFRRAAVYTSISPLINSLKDDYELMLIHFSQEEGADIDYSIFKERIFINSSNGTLDAMNSALASEAMQNINVIIYPDIGMTVESVTLSNLRIAPIQICLYGHPVSTFGSKIDYFIGGQDVENIAAASENYSERLVVIPGLAAQAVWPAYQKRDLYKPQVDKIFICCSWGASKFNYPMLLNLRKVIDRANKQVVFRFLPNWSLNSQNRFIPFYKDISDVLGTDHIEVFSDCNVYDYYMRIIESTDFAIDSYPFGGFNTIVDNLYLEKPVIAYESHKAYGSFAAAILRKLKCEDFITHSDEEYICKIVELINHPEKLQQAKSRFKFAEIKQVIDNLTDNRYFKKAIDHLIANHAKYAKQSTKDPIIIEKDVLHKN